MITQMASGLSLMVEWKIFDDFEGALCVAFPLMTGLLISHTPQIVFSGFPDILPSHNWQRFRHGRALRSDHGARNLEKKKPVARAP
jgi:hypothetical protein